MKNKFLNQTCFVLGNGPSLTVELLKKISEKQFPVFVSNGFCLIFDSIDFQPDFVCMSNNDAVIKYLDSYSDETVKFIKEGLVDPKKFNNLYELPFECEHDKGEHKSPFIKDGHFSENPFEINYCGETVLLEFAIPLAYYMGFKTIFLAGVDCDYSKGHFVNNYSASCTKDFKGMINDDYSIAIPSYKYTYDYLKSQGVKILRLTKSPRLDFIPIVEFN